MVSFRQIFDRSAAYHPFLFVIFPIIFAYANNMHEIKTVQVFLPIVIVLSIIFLLWFGLRFFFNNKRKIALIISLLIVLFFSYGHVYLFINDFSVDSIISVKTTEEHIAIEGVEENTVVDIDLGRHRFLIIPFLASMTIGIWYFLRTKRKLDNASVISNTIAGTLILIVIVNISTFNFEENFSETKNLDFSVSDYRLLSEDKKLTVTKDFGKPDVYLIILDEYANSKSLEKDLKFDNKKFTDFLQNRGFYIPSKSFSNYPMTILSVPSMMNMKYLNDLSLEMGVDSKDHLILHELVLENEIMKKFKSLNYKIINYGSLWGSEDQYRTSDENICKNNKIKEIELLENVARTSMIGYFIERWSEESMRNVTLCIFSDLPVIHERNSEPIFVFAHILIPHPPFLFGPNGEEIVPGNTIDGSPWNVKDAYLDQLEFTNKKTSEVVETILSTSSREPIIIIMSDHGLGFDVNWKEPNSEMVERRLSNFNAYYFPHEKKNELYDEITPVNSFRKVLNTYFNADYEILEDRLYWSHSSRPYDFRDVTEKIDYLD